MTSARGSRPRGPVVVIAVGNVMRRDDGVGPAVVDALSVEAVEVDLLTLDGEPTGLIDAWEGRDLAIVVDAAVTGAAPGTVHRAEVDPATGYRRRATADAEASWGSTASSHAAGVGQALALARVLDRAPHRLVLYGVEVGDLELGPGLSPAVAAAVAPAAARIGDEALSWTAANR